MTGLDNLGAILCPITSTKFLDSGKTEMREEFVCSQAVTYESVEEAIRKAQKEVVPIRSFVTAVAPGLRSGH